VTEIGLWNIARTNPDRTAVVDPAGQEITYADLAAAADRYGRGMQERGLVPGDCIVVMLPNGIDLLAMYFAAIECGLYIVPINWHLTGPEVAYIVGDCDAKVFVADERFATAAVVAAADLPTEAMAQIKVGQRATFRAIGLDGLVEGRVAQVSPSLSQDGRTLRVRVEVPNPDGLLKGGLFVEGVILGEGETRSAALPASWPPEPQSIAAGFSSRAMPTMPTARANTSRRAGRTRRKTAMITATHSGIV